MSAFGSGLTPALAPETTIGGTVPFSQPGSAATGASGAWTAPDAGTVTKVILSVTAAPTGSDLVVQFRRNGSAFVTLTIPAGTTATQTSTPGQAFDADDAITVNATSVGSTVAAVGVVAQVNYELD